jgi:hypothetical protein
MIFLVSVDPSTQKETHMIWEGHTSLEDAKKCVILVGCIKMCL